MWCISGVACVGCCRDRFYSIGLSSYTIPRKLRDNVSSLVNHVGVFADVLLNHEWDLVIKAIGPCGLFESLSRPGFKHHCTLFHRYSLLGDRSYLILDENTSGHDRIEILLLPRKG